MVSDDSNLMLADSQERADELNAAFYGRFPFPWRPMKFDSLLDPQFQTRMLNQNLGDWRHGRLGPRMRIWVAGCGTNQAVITALNFPQAEVVGSDLSGESLGLAAGTARELGLGNLELRRESINAAGYVEEFDYVICTGVIHHNANPEATLKKLSEALKREGVMELMVYNRYERLPTTAFQKAVRLLGANSGPVDYEADLARAKRIVREVKLKNFATLTQTSVESYPDCLLADLLIQPVENSYTVESFEELADDCGLEMLYPCCDMFDKGMKNVSWDLTFSDEELQAAYEALPDARRWQVTNHLLFERSPQLWFYFQRRDGGLSRKPEREVCAEFLETRFVRAATTQRSFIRQPDGHYELSPHVHPYPVSVPKALLKEIVEAADGQRTMGEIFHRLNIDQSFRSVNQARLQLTTSAFPRLQAMPSVESKPHPDAAGKQMLAEARFKKFKSIRPKGISLPPQGD